MTPFDAEDDTAATPVEGSIESDSELIRAYPMRLQRFLARAGVASRRGSEDLMTAGRVTVNGRVVSELGAKVDPASDEVAVDGKPVSLSGSPVYVAINKPAGFVTTMSDPHARHTVAELVPTDQYPGLFPIGRLDQDTTGLLLFTTDGDLGFRLLHPKFHVAKTYQVVADGRVDDDAATRLRSGVRLDDGMTAPADVRILEASGTSRLEITIREGRKRQVRRMFSAVGHPVVELHRTSFGPVRLGDLGSGAVRELTRTEVTDLRHAAGLGDDTGSTVRPQSDDQAKAGE